MKTRLILFASLLGLIVLAGFRSGERTAFYKGNLHTHSLWSDGNALPEEVAGWYRSHGYQFLAVTDHNLLQEGKKNRVIGKDTVTLKTLAEYRGSFEKAGEFLLICSEEITDGAEKRPVHLNGINLSVPVNPCKGPTVAECLNANVDAIRKALTASGNPEWITVNHPNFGWGLTAGDLARCGARFFEVFNGHPSVRNYGDSIHPSTEEMWDEANRWRAENGKPLLLGVATDDAHQYDQFGPGKANPGRGWVMVRAPRLEAADLYTSMMAGDFYASTGVVLKDFRFDGRTLRIAVKSEPGVGYTTEFIGWLKGKDKPEVLATSTGTRPVFRLSGNELFVRARIRSDKPAGNPYEEGDRGVAWTQPVCF